MVKGWFLVWFDDSDKNLAEKVKEAAARYVGKFGEYPDRCYIHPSALGGKAWTKVGEVRVCAMVSALPHHLWIGVREDEKSHEDEKS